MSIRTLCAALLATLVAPSLSAQTLLYEQPANGTVSGVGTVPDDTFGWIYSENFIETANDGVDSYLADDFVIPDGTAWSISEISVVSFYVGGITLEKARDFNLIIWSNDAANGTPDAEVYRLNDVDPTSDGTSSSPLTAGVISFTLDTPVVLNSGTYWLTVQANNPVANTQSGTRYVWRSDATAFNEPLQLWNYGGILAGAAPCDADWGDNAPECGNVNRNNNEPSVYFKLAGSTTVASEEAAESQIVSILPTRPNPATDRALVPFTLRQPADVRLAVYDALGREVALVADRSYGAGEHAEPLDTSDLAPGTYVVRLVAGADVVLRTISVVR